MNKQTVIEDFAKYLVDNMGNKLTEALVNGLLLKLNGLIPEVILPEKPDDVPVAFEIDLEPKTEDPLKASPLPQRDILSGSLFKGDV